MSEKNLGGRPHGLTPELLEKAKQYVNKPLFETYQKEVVVKDQIQVINLERPNWVSVAGLACELDVWRKTIYNWSDKNHASFSEEFLHIFEALQKKQEMLLEYHALTKGYDGGFAKFLACNLTKYKEKREDTVTGEISIKLPDAKLTDV
jgi:predicted DNA-binding protein YlxM (UPF0122 family)